MSSVRRYALLIATVLAVALPGIAAAQQLVGHWTFDGNLNDSSGHNNHARRNATAAFVRTEGLQSLRLNGGAVTIPDSNSLQTEQFTVSYRVRLDGATGYAPIASKGAAWQTSIVAGLDSEGRAIGGQSLRLCVSGVCGTSPALSLSPVGRWTSVAFTYDGKTATTYADGLAVSTFEVTPIPGNSTGDIQLGDASNSSALIRDLRVYDSTVTLAGGLDLGPSAVLGVTAVTVGSAGASSSAVLYATGAWTATANASFLHLSAGSTSGTGSALVVFSADAFAGTGSRSGTLTIAGVTLTVTQAGTNYAAAPQAASFLSLPKEYGIYTVSVNASVVDSSGIVYFLGSSIQDGADILAKLDTATGQVTRLVTGISGSMAINGAGDVYILDTGSSVIKKWSASAQQLTTVVSGINGSGITVDRNNNLYVADTTGAAIRKVTGSTVTTLLSGLKYVYGVAVDAAFNVYYTETDHSAINKAQDYYNYNGGNGFYTYRPAGTDNGAIREWNAATQQVTTVAALNHPYGLTVDGSGNLYAIDINYTGDACCQNIAWSTSGDPFYNLVRKWTAATGQLTTLVQGAAAAYSPFLAAGRDLQVAVAGEGDVYFPSKAQGIYEVPYAFIPSIAINVALGSGNGTLPPVLPATTTGLTGTLKPASDQSWLTIGTISSGKVNFSYTAHPAAPSTAHITIDGIQSSVTQTVTVPNVLGLTQAAATTSIVNGNLAVGNVSTALSSTVAAGLVISSGPAAGVQVPAASAVNLLVSAGSAALGSTSFQAGSAASASTVVLSSSGSWTAVSNDSFLHVAQGSASGSGSALIAFTIDVFNGTGSRVGTLTIAGLTFTVTQMGTNFLPSQQFAFSINTGFYGVVQSNGTTLSVASEPSGVAFDASANVYIADSATSQVDRLTPGAQYAPALISGLGTPRQVATDAAGNLYIAESGSNAIKKWTAATGQTTTLVSAGLASPAGVAVDSSGNLYIADTGNNAIKEWNVTSGVVTTLVSGLNQPRGAAVDRGGNVYFSDTGNNAIKEWSVTAGTVTTLVSGLNGPTGLAVDGNGNVYIADSQNSAVKKWTAASGQVTTLDTFVSPFPFNPSLYVYPTGVAVNASGTSVYESFSSNEDTVTGGVRELTLGFVQVAAVPNVVSQTQAAASSAITGVGLVVGSVTTGLSSTVPVGSVISSNPVAGTVLNIGSAVNLVISAAGIPVPNVVGQTQAAATSGITGVSLALGTVTTALSTTVPTGSVISQSPAAGTVAATGSAVNLVISAGTITPNVIGQTQAAATAALAGAGLTAGTVTTTVSPSGLSNPGQVISDGVGNVYIADTANNAIKKWNAATGQLITLVSSGLNAPAGVGLDKAGNVYIADTGNNAVKEWNAATSQVTTLVSTGLNHPQAIVVDRYFRGSYAALGAQQVGSNGDVYIADTGNNALKVWTAATQQVTTLVSAGLNQPAGVGFCIGGSVYIADTGNNAIKRYSSGQLSTAVSSGLNHPTGVVCASYVDNATAYFNNPNTAVLDFIPYSDLYIADTGNSAIKYWPSGNQPQLFTVASGFNQPVSIASDGLDTIWVPNAGNNSLEKLACNAGAGQYCGGLGARTRTTLFRSVAPGTVLNSSPAAGTSVNVGSPVNLTIEGGLAALSANSILVGSSGGSSSVYLTVRSGSLQGPWTSVSNAAFLHTAASGAGSAAVAFTVDPFTGAGSRTGTLTIAGFTFTVTQVGADYVATGQLGTPLAGGFNLPSGVAVDGFGNIYIADTSNNAIKVSAAGTQQVTTLISSGLSGPLAIAVDGDSNLYIGDNTAIRLWTAATGQMTTLVSGLSSVSGLAVDSAGNVYFSNGFATLSKWTAATQQVTTLSTAFQTPRGVTLDSSGNVYVADGAGNAIKMWSASTQQVTTLVSNLIGSWGMALDPFSGDIYFSETRNSFIKKLSGGTVTPLVQGSPAGTTNRYRGVALDGSGNVYFAQTDNNLIGQLSRAYVSSGSLSEPNTAGTDALPPVIPMTTSLTGASSPVSDQAWLTVGGVTNGVVSFSFTANATGAPRTGHITVLGVPFTVSQGLQVAVPDVVGQTQAAAATAITGAGLVVGTVTTASSGTVASGSVIGTNPLAAAQVNFGSAVNLVVSSGPAQVAVPDVAGQTQAAAATAITSAGLTLGTVTTASSSIVASGSVISTNPVAATQVSIGSAVNLVVSSGPAQVAVPNVAGQTQAAATTAITGAGLTVGALTTASSSTVASGSVISTNPPAATQVNLGSAVNLIVSSGPAQVAVPNVAGQTQAAAATAITGAGLTVGTVTTASSSTVASGSVISTNPPAATQVNLGSAVNLIVSSGPAQVPAPDMTPQFTVTRGAALLNRGTGRYTQSVTVSNSGAAASAAAFVLDNLSAGYVLYQPTGSTVATAPVGSPFKEMGSIGAGATVTFTLEFTRTGTAALAYTARILGPGTR